MSNQRKFTSLTDWLAARRAGLDPGIRPIPEHRHQPLGGMPQPPMPDRTPVSFPLFVPRGMSARDRKREVDRILKQWEVTPRKRVRQEPVRTEPARREELPGQRVVRTLGQVVNVR